MFEYEMSVKTNPDIGHAAVSALRDGIEDVVGSSVEEGENLTAEVVSGSEIAVHVSTPREIGDREAAGFRDAIENAVRGILDAEAGETVTVGEMAMRAYPGSAPGR